MLRPQDCFALEEVEVVRQSKVVLRIPDLNIARGETTAVVGPSGAGKSTFLRLLAGLEPPASGRVWSQRPEGKPLAPGRSVMVFQRPVLLRGSVIRNVAVGLQLRGERKPGGRAAAVLGRLGLADKAARQVHTLSGGEYQRAALARALVLEPEALLLDEPTANLDPENVALIETLVREIQTERGMTVVWVTHNPFQARRVARSAVLLVGGEIVEHSGTGVFFSGEARPRTQDFLAGRMVW